MRVVCTACSCLCDDIVVGDKIYHACRKGYRLLKGSKEENTIRGERVTLEKAIKKAREVIDGKKLLVFGLDNLTCEAQELALKLSMEFNATIVDHSFLSNVLNFLELESVQLEKFRDEGYVSIFWGSNPHNNVPRLLSRFTYYPRSGKRQRGYEEDRFLVVADVRKSETAKIAEKSKSGIFIKIENDDELATSFLKAIEGKAGKHVDVARVLKEIEKAEVNAVFGGGGLFSGLKNFEAFREFLEKTNLKFVPILKTNMRGYVELMLNRVGSNIYDFREGRAISRSEVIDVFKEVEAVVVISADPFRTLPSEYSKLLAEKELIVVNSLKSITSKFAEVTIATQPSNLSGGTMIRCDGVRVKIPKVSEGYSDVDFLKSLLE